MATLGAYGWFVRGPFSWRRYLLLLLMFALGLMAKPMLVTLPALLLVLDYWPLGRMSATATLPPGPGRALAGRANFVPAKRGFSVLRRLVLEKVPLLLLVAVFCLLTIWAQGQASAFDTYLGPFWRIANALVCYVTYLVQFFWPVGLAAFYPHPEYHLSMWKAFGCWYPGGHLRGGVEMAAAISILARGLAMVRGRARARQRHRPSRVAGHGRPLHLFAADRVVPCLGLGSRRRLPVWPYRRWLYGVGRRWCWRS